MGFIAIEIEPASVRSDEELPLTLVGERGIFRNLWRRQRAMKIPDCSSDPDSKDRGGDQPSLSGGKLYLRSTPVLLVCDGRITMLLLVFD